MSRANQIGRYAVDDVWREEPLGRVVRSRMPRLERGVLIREFAPSAALEPAVRARLRDAFAEECRALARVSDPRLCEALEADDTDGGAYLVAPRPEPGGYEPLDNLKGLPAAQWVAIAGEIARALADLAAAGVTLRRFRPEDVWVLPPAQIRLAHLDFGSLALAAGLGEHSGGGEPGAFLAPEVARGEPGCEASAVFSLAAWLYGRLAPGAPPAAETARRGWTPEALFALNPGVRAGVDDALQAALHPDPAARTPRLAQLAAALPSLADAPLAPTPVASAVSPPGLPAGEEWPPAVRFVAWGLGLTLLSGVSGWLLALLFPPRR